MNNQPLVVEHIVGAPLEKVWAALTDNNKMKEWYFQLPEFKAEPGFEVKFDIVFDDKRWVHMWKVKEVLPYEKISYSWKYEGYKGESLVKFELLPEGDQTRVRVIHEGLETFPAEAKQLSRENFEQGWNSIIGTSLREFVETSHINYSFEVKAPAAKVWKLLTDNNLSKQWAGAFGEGVYCESDWQPGSSVAWRSAEGELGAIGKVVTREDNSKLVVGFYDTLEPGPNEQLGNYCESYALTEKDGVTTVTVDSGPLPIKHIRQHAPLWEVAVQRIKELAEKS